MTTRRASRDSLTLLLAGLLAGALAGWMLGQLASGGALHSGNAGGQDQRLRDDLVLMIATAYNSDGDLATAWRRLQQVANGDSVALLQSTAGRYIANSRDVRDIRFLVSFAQGLGRLTPAMEPFLLPGPADAGP